MKKILLSVTSIIFAGAILAGGTGAFLSDSGTSTGNTFATGVVDLKIDNESYITNNDGVLVYSPITSWSLSKLEGHLFFNFGDVKPGDIGEDTISLHVNNNNAWMCMNINLTATPENGQPDPEVAVDPTSGVNDGELQDHLYFTFWADDGDNVYETGEKVFKKGLVKDIWNGQNWPIADSQTNIWGTPGPLLGNTTKYIAKAWCFGTSTETPISQDGLGKTGTNGPLARGTGFKCDGKDVGNVVQSDGINADVSFSVVQSRSNSAFICGGTSTTTVPKHTSTFLGENFESYIPGSEWTETWPDGSSNFDWDEVGGVKILHVSGEAGQLADLNADNNNASVTNNKEVLRATYLDLVGYNTIVFKYDRKTDDVSGPVNPQTLIIDYSVDDGASWTTLETVVGESGWSTKTFSLSPAADNKPRVKVRFSLTGTNATNHAYIDNVTVVGTAI
jgi:hypothetical protein